MVERLTASNQAMEETVFVRPGEQVAGVPDLLGGHGRRASQALAAGAGGGQALAGAFQGCGTGRKRPPW
jgi:hypothetical protein